MRGDMKSRKIEVNDDHVLSDVNFVLQSAAGNIEEEEVDSIRFLEEATFPVFFGTRPGNGVDGVSLPVRCSSPLV
jgi:hypothetical protein